MQERELRLDELVDRVADLERIDAEPVHLTDVESERGGWLTANLRLLSAIGSLGPGELGSGSDSPGLHWGNLRVLAPVRPGDDELFVVQDEKERRQWLRLLPPARRDPRRGRRDLEHEAELLARIEHPGLARVRGAGSNEGRSGMWADAVDGEWLLDRIAEPLEWPVACDLVVTVAEVVSVLHSHGLIHRRLTPDRIVLGATGPVLVDLGAREAMASPDADDDAPEVARGAAPTVRSDVYALGQLLVRAAGLDPSSTRAPGLDALLHPEPEHRPASATEAAEILRSLRQHDPRVETPVAPNRGWRRLFRRRSP